MDVPVCHVIHVEPLLTASGLIAHVSIKCPKCVEAGCGARGTGWSLCVLNCPDSWTDWTHDARVWRECVAVDADF